MRSHQMAVVLVSLAEKVLGTGFDPLTDQCLVNEFPQYLDENLTAPPPRPSPDAFLEMAYEDRVSGWNE